MSKPQKKASKKHPQKIYESPLMGIVRDNMRALRLSRGWTQLRLADALGVSQAYVCSLEGAIDPGKRRPIHLDFLFHMAATLGTSPADMVTPGRFTFAGELPRSKRRAS